MFARKRAPKAAVILAALSMLVTACSEGANPTSASEPEPTSSVVFTEPVEGEVPAQQGQIAGSGAPAAFPVLLEENGVHAYLKSMFTINRAALKNRRPYEAMPQLVEVKGKAACRKEPAAQNEKPAYVVGDKAPKGSPTLATCVKDGKLVIFYAKKTFYNFYRDQNPKEVRALVIGAFQDYLAQLTSNRLGGGQGYFWECAGGRLIGGLRDHGYIEKYWANIQGVDGPIDTQAERIYLEARETGHCPNTALDYWTS